MKHDDVIVRLEDARAILPELKAMLSIANLELSDRASTLEEASDEYENAEYELACVKAGSSTAQEITKLRNNRRQFQSSIEKLSNAQREYEECLHCWEERISDMGVLLRDIRTGLLDFPAREGDFEYFLCWRSGEDDINFWHPINDGFIGRRPMAVLSEYF
jgi:hypothetical protein